MNTKRRKKLSYLPVMSSILIEYIFSSAKWQTYRLHHDLLQSLLA